MDSTPSASSTGMLRAMVALCVFTYALYVFSGNTTDVDLWGHVLFGAEALARGQVPHAEPYSWTAPNHPWINHEVVAELILAAGHRLLGGPGILLIMLVCALGTFALALRLGTQGLAWPATLGAWLIGVIAANEMAFGFAARPQIFTALYLAFLLWILRRLDQGHVRAAWLLPALFLVWINTHGGALAGIVLLAAGGAGMVIDGWLRTRSLSSVPRWPFFAVPACVAVLFVNPWGPGLVRWLIASVLWLRPEIEEWNPTPLNAQHAAFFVLLAVAVASLALSRRKRATWEMLVLAALAFAAWRSVRHTPLFSIVALALVPPHLASAAGRMGESTAGLRAALARPILQVVLALALLALSVVNAVAAVRAHKERCWTMEVPRAQFPLAALAFMKQYGLQGNLLVYFDWGELCLWELPDSRVSVDGRLDTCYPRGVIEAHWKLYRGDAVDPAVLDVERADVALLPHLEGSKALSHRAGWQAVYVDPLAVVIVRDIARFQLLNGVTVPVVAGDEAVSGRAPFPAAR